MKWAIDPDHSAAVFSIKHMMVTNVWGHFSKVSGTIFFDPADPSGSSVEAEIDVSSLSTGNKKRDEHLLSGDFFEISDFPKIYFRSTGAEIAGKKSGKISGNLSLHGITRPITLDVKYSGPVKSPVEIGGETSIGFTAETTINREDYGILWNVPLDGGNLMVGKDVSITLNIEADLVEET